jgi:hypothetical protein
MCILWAAKIGCRRASAHVEGRDIVYETPVSELISQDHRQNIVGWTKAWYEQALAANLVSFPYRVDNETVKRLHRYFREGLTPEEALHACFGDLKQ